MCSLEQIYGNTRTNFSACVDRSSGGHFSQRRKCHSLTRALKPASGRTSQRRRRRRRRRSQTGLGRPVPDYDDVATLGAARDRRHFFYVLKSDFFGPVCVCGGDDEVDLRNGSDPTKDERRRRRLMAAATASGGKVQLGGECGVR
jgi:hypothetical protein